MNHQPLDPTRRRSISTRPLPDLLAAARGHPRPVRTATGSPTRPRCSSRSPCCAGTSAATARSRSHRLGSSRPISPPTRCWPSPGPEPQSAATRRCSPSASGPSCATRRRRRGSTSTAMRRTVDYLVAMAALVLTETGLLPHANAGALHRRRTAGAPCRQPLPGDDDREPACRPRLPPRSPRQGARAAPGHPRGCR